MNLPPLFDNITDEDLSKMSKDANILMMEVNKLREKQLHGGGLSDEEVKEGIRLLNELRVLRAGKASSTESRAPLESLF